MIVLSSVALAIFLISNKPISSPDPASEGELHFLYGNPDSVEGLRRKDQAVLMCEPAIFVVVVLGMKTTDGHKYESSLPRIEARIAIHRFDDDNQTFPREI